MGLYSLALFLPSRFPTFPQTSLSLSLSRSLSLSPARAEPATLVPLPATRLSFSPPLPTVSLALLPPHAANSSPTLQGVPSFSPVPPDRLKLQSVASPSVGTLIRGRLHCSGTLLAALGYQLFPSSLSVPPSSPSLFLARGLFRFSPFSSTAVASFFVLLSEDLRIHGRSLRFLIIPA